MYRDCVLRVWDFADKVSALVRRAVLRMLERGTDPKLPIPSKAREPILSGAIAVLLGIFLVIRFGRARKNEEPRA